MTKIQKSIQPKVSVCVPVYNTASYLTKCLESIINQTLQEIEIIIINDASTDDSQQCIEKYAQRDNRIRVIQNTQNKKTGASRNDAIKIAMGEFIGFVDSDDWIAPNMFEIMYNTAIKNQVDAVVCRLGYVYHNNKDNKHLKIKSTLGPKIKKKIKTEEALKYWMVYQELHHCPVLYLLKRNNVLKHNILFPEGISREDIIFSFLVVCNTHELYLLPELLYYYYQNNTSSTSHTTQYHIEGIDFSLIEVKKWLLKKNIFCEYKNIFYQNMWLYECHQQFSKLASDTLQYSNFFIGHPLLKSMYKVMKEHSPLKKPPSLNFKQQCIYIAFTYPKFVFITFYIIVKLFHQIRFWTK